MSYTTCGVCGETEYLPGLRRRLEGDKAFASYHICAVPDDVYIEYKMPPHRFCQYCGERITANRPYMKSATRDVYLHTYCHRRWIENGKKRKRA